MDGYGQSFDVFLKGSLEPFFFRRIVDEDDFVDQPTRRPVDNGMKRAQQCRVGLVVKHDYHTSGRQRAKVLVGFPFAISHSDV